MSLVLSDVACLPLEDRAAFVERFGRDDLVATVEALKRAGSPCGVAVTPARVAWAMAFNVRVPEDPTGTTRSGISPRFAGRKSKDEQDRWSSETQWDTVWAFFVRRHDTLIFKNDEEEPATRTLLRELARSVACERRCDWPWSAQPVDDALAAECLNEVFELSCARVRGVLARYPVWWIARDEIISTMWERAIDTAWGPAADKRFVARSLISSWLCAIALNTARNHARAEARQRKREEAWSDSHETVYVADATEDEDGSEADPATNVELTRRFRECIETLDERDRDLLRHFLNGATPTQIARARGTRPPTVSQHQDRLVRDLRRCFSERRVRPGTTKQKVFKALRDQLAALGPELLPFLRKGSPEDRKR